MSGFFHFLNQNTGALTALFTGVVAISTIFYVMLTRALVNETKAMRRTHTEPKISIVFRSQEQWGALLDLETKNIGLGPAYDIKFTLSQSEKYPIPFWAEKAFKDISYFQTGLNYLAPGQYICAFLTDINEDFENRISSKVCIGVSYKSKSDNQSVEKYTEDFILDFSILRGKWLETSPIFGIAKNIEKITKGIENFASGFKRLRTDIYTTQDREKEKTERKERKSEFLKQQKDKLESDENQQKS